MKGPHDDKLEQSGHWPLRGIKVELLNQLNDNNHHTDWIMFGGNHCNNIARSVEDGTAW